MFGEMPILYDPVTVVGACKSSEQTATLLDVPASDQLGDGCYCQKVKGTNLSTAKDFFQ